MKEQGHRKNGSAARDELMASGMVHMTHMTHMTHENMDTSDRLENEMQTADSSPSASSSYHGSSISPLPLPSPILFNTSFARPLFSITQILFLVLVVCCLNKLVVSIAVGWMSSPRPASCRRRVCSSVLFRSSLVKPRPLSCI